MSKPRLKIVAPSIGGFLLPVTRLTCRGYMALLIGFFVLLTILAIAVRFGKSAPTTLEGISGRPILSIPELAFYHQLCRALPQLRVFPQVAVNAILETQKGLSRAKKTSLRNRYSQWHVDFAICEPANLKIVGIVEFDGQRHNANNDAWRDKILAQGGYAVHRFHAKQTYSDQDIAVRFGQNPSPVITKEQF